MDASLSEVVSSPVRLKIMDLVSIRPRSLGELAWENGITVQAVLRHLRRLAELGLVEERAVGRGALKVRRLYAAKSLAVGDYSTADLTVVKATERTPTVHPQGEKLDLEALAQDTMFQKRRIREQARRLGREIEALVETQNALLHGLSSSELDETDRLILQVVYAEESMEKAAEVLARHYGVVGRRSIDAALAKAKRIGK